MIRVNLIRGKRKRRRDPSAGVAFLAVPLLVLLGILYFHTTVTGKIERLQRDVAAANAQVERLKKEIGEVEKFKIRKAELQKKVDIISALQKNRIGLIRYFEALSAAIPEKCSLNKLELRAGKVSVSGVALNNDTVANFMTALAQTGRFRDVVLGAAEQTAVQNTKIVRFTLTFQTVD